jgi:predicted glycosyltransferase
MRVLFDIVHPAHVHFYKHLYRRLINEGAECAVVARDKDVTLALLDAYEIPYRTQGRPHRGLVGQGAELAARDWTLWRVSRHLHPDVVLARNPAGMQVARVVGAIGVFDTDNGTSAGIHFRLAAPFANVITTPSCFTEDYGAKHRRFPGYKALAFLHPDHFTPDADAAYSALGVPVGEPFALVRLVAMDASHDHNEQGLDIEKARRLVAMLSERGHVFVSAEGRLPDEFEEFRIRIPPERMHDVLAFASIIVGDSGSMVGEAAVLGTPNVFYGSFAGRLEYLNDLEHRFDLARSFRPEQGSEMLQEVDVLTADATERERWQERRAKMLEECVDVSSWYHDLVEELVQAR